MTGLLVSDFNAANLGAYLNNATDLPDLRCEVAQYGSVFQCLLQGDGEDAAPRHDYLIVWTRPQAILQSFSRVLCGYSVNMESLMNEVDEFCDAVLRAKHRATMVFVPLWTVPTIHGGNGLLELSREFGVTRCLMEANMRLLQRLDGQSQFVVLNANKWIELAGERAHNPRLWYLGKIPFANDVFKAAARDIAAAIRGMLGRARKLIVVDLDDTLWGGLVGDVGWDGLVLGGHDAEGEALQDFQRGLKALAAHGVILAIASKNDESTALEALRMHPEMVLREEDFAAWRINWDDKAANILSLVEELNLGLESVVFIDDNPAERARVKEHFPEILVPDWPADKRLYPQALNALDCFDKPQVSDEDRNRQAMYLIERKRNQSKLQAGSLEDWLRGLGLVVRMLPLDRSNSMRIGQLLNKTNQMNLRTRRLSEEALLDWAAQPERHVWGVAVSDRLGDYGLCGILALQRSGDAVDVVDFVLSCRVMGRRIEEAMIGFAIRWGRRTGARQLLAALVPSKRNLPCRRFFEKSGLRQLDETDFSWDLSNEYPTQPAIQLSAAEFDKL